MRSNLNVDGARIHVETRNAEDKVIKSVEVCVCVCVCVCLRTLSAAFLAVSCCTCMLCCTASERSPTTEAAIVMSRRRVSSYGHTHTHTHTLERGTGEAPVCMLCEADQNTDT